MRQRLFQIVCSSYLRWGIKSADNSSLTIECVLAKTYIVCVPVGRLMNVANSDLKCLVYQDSRWHWTAKRSTCPWAPSAYVRVHPWDGKCLLFHIIGITWVLVLLFVQWICVESKHNSFSLQTATCTCTGSWSSTVVIICPCPCLCNAGRADSMGGRTDSHRENFLAQVQVVVEKVKNEILFVPQLNRLVSRRFIYRTGGPITLSFREQNCIPCNSSSIKEWT